MLSSAPAFARPVEIHRYKGSILVLDGIQRGQAIRSRCWAKQIGSAELSLIFMLEALRIGPAAATLSALKSPSVRSGYTLHFAPSLPRPQTLLQPFAVPRPKSDLLAFGFLQRIYKEKTYR